MTSTSYPQNAKDWRGLFIKDMVDSLASNQGVNLTLWAPPGDIPHSVSNACSAKESYWLSNLLEQGGIAHILRNGKGVSRITTPIRLLWLLRQVYFRYPNIDLFHVNWLQNILPLWRTKKPVLVTVLGSDLGLLRLPGMSYALRQVLKQRRSIIAPNADWMTVELEKHFGDISQILPIPFGINAKWYQLSRSWQTQKTKKWIVVSRVTENKIGSLFDWGGTMFQQGEHELHLFGPMQEQLKIPNWVNYHGATHPKELQDNWFPQAAGLITLSKHDEGRPQVILEAMAAGLPILASPLPAHTNLLTHKKTGWLANSEAEFHAGIHWLAESKNNKEISCQARNWVKNNIGTWADCAQRYLTAYGQLLKD
ncbi:MAG: glycosyltransferase [Desulfamplus sp.]|nr:glycosyltransferase [Desulfamplus sp.]